MRIGLLMPVSWEPIREFLPKDVELPKPLEFVFGAELAAELIRRGHVVHIFSFCSSMTAPMTINGDGLYLHLAGYHANMQLCAACGYSRETAIMRDFITRYPCDVYNAHWQYEFALPVVLHNVKHVVTVRDNPWRVLWMFKPHIYRFLRLIIAYYVLWRAKNISVASPYMADYCRRYHGFKGVVPIIPNALKISAISKKRQSDDVVRFVEISNGFSSCKNIATLIDAFIIATKTSTMPMELHVYGSGNEMGGEAGRYIKRMRYSSNNVFLHGRVSHDEMLHEISGYADVFVHASREESFGNVIVEAMALGLPTIVGRNSGAASWVAGDGETGLLVDVKDGIAIANAMIKMAEDVNYRREMGIAARKRYLDNFTITAVAGQYERMYEEIAR